MSNGTQTPPTHDNGGLLQAISQHIFLVALHIGWPKLSHKIDDVIVEVQDESGTKQEVDKDLRTDPLLQLMPEEWWKKFSNIEGRGRTALRRRARSFSTQGMSLLPIIKSAETFAELRDIRAEFEATRDEFVPAYGRILERLHTRLLQTFSAETASKITARLPEVSEIRDKFKFTWAIVPLGGDSTFDPSPLNQVLELIDSTTSGNDLAPHVYVERLEQIRSVVWEFTRQFRQAPRTVNDTVANDLVREARQQMTAYVDTFVEDFCRGPRAELAAMVKNMEDALLDDNRVIRAGTINQVQQAIEHMQGFRFLADDTLLDRMTNLQNHLNRTTVQALNADPEISAGLLGTLRACREQAENAVAATQTLRQFRGINIRRHEEAEEPTPAAV